MTAICLSLFMLLIFKAHVHGQNLKIKAVITPNLVYLKEGSSMSWSCTNMMHANTTDIMNLQQNSVFFKWGNSSFTYPTDVQIAPRTWTAILRLHNITRRLNADGWSSDEKMQCFWNNLKVAQAKVVIIRNPLSPVISHCKVLNWRNVTCVWSPNQLNQTIHTYMTNLKEIQQVLRWTVVSHTNKTGSATFSWNVCEDMTSDSNSCSWRPLASEIETFCVQILVEAPVTMQGRLTAHSQVTCYNTSQIVQLAQPIIQEDKTTMLNRSCVITIQSAAITSAHDVIYNVTYTSRWGKNNILKKSSSEKSTSVTLEVIPYTIYNVTIEVRDVNSHYWSLPSREYSFRSRSASPCAQPRVTSDAFTLSDNELKQSRTVNVYYKSVAEVDFCGPRFFYYLQICKYWSVNTSNVPPKSWKSFKSNSSGSLELDNDAQNISIIATNEFSENSEDKLSNNPNIVIQIPKKKKVPTATLR